AHGHDEEEIVSVLLDATKAAAGAAGDFWNWSREERAIRGMIASARTKFSSAERRVNPAARPAPSEPAGERANVVSLAEARTRQQAKPKEKPRGDAPLIARLGEAVLAYWQEHRPALARIDGGLWCYANGFWSPFDD